MLDLTKEKLFYINESSKYNKDNVHRTRVNVNNIIHEIKSNAILSTRVEQVAYHADNTYGNQTQPIPLDQWLNCAFRLFHVHIKETYMFYSDCCAVDISVVDIF